MKKYIGLMILASMLTATACGGQTEGTPGVTDTAALTETAAVTEAVVDHYYDHIEARDLGGKEFRIISRMTQEGHNAQSFTDYGNNEIDAKETNGTQINDTVYARNRELESRYNFVFNSIQPNLDAMATAKKSILASSDDYDAIVDSLVQMNDYSMFCSFDDLDYIDLTADCWDHNANSSLSFGGDHYVAIGDLLILDKKGTWCMIFNKKLAANYDLGNLYDIVREGRWTLDTFWSMAKLASSDLNGNGKQDEEDNWGYLGENYNANFMMFGCGTRISEKSNEDYPVLSLMNERSVTAYAKVHEIVTDRSVSLSMSWSKNGPADCLTAFAEDRGLFYMTGIGTAMEYRYMESDFGILPIPKLNEEQEKHYTSLSGANSACIAIPICNASADDSAFLLQAICLASTDTLKATFYDTVLTGITARDEESREMLDIIFDNRVFDMAFINNWGGMGGIFTSLLSQKSPDFASSYEKLEKKAVTAIEKAITEFEERQNS